MNIIKKCSELGDELCNYCPLDDDLKGLKSTPCGHSAGCEGSHCQEAYENYLTDNEV